MPILRPNHIDKPKVSYPNISGWIVRWESSFSHIRYPKQSGSTITVTNQHNFFFANANRLFAATRANATLFSLNPSFDFFEGVNLWRFESAAK